MSKSCFKRFTTQSQFFLFFSTLLLVVHLIFLAYDLSHCNKVESVVNEAIVDDKYVSFTLCSNVPVKREFGTAPKVDPQYHSYQDYHRADFFFETMMYFEDDFKVQNKYSNGSYWNVTHLTKKNEMTLLSEMVKLGEKERILYSLFPDTKLIISIKEESSLANEIKISKLKFLMSNNLFYGNCITFNPSLYGNFDPKNSELSVLITNDVLQHRNGMANQTDMPWKRQILVIHPFNTEPIFDSRNIIKVPADSKTIITVTKTAFVHETDCEENRETEVEDSPRKAGQYFDDHNYTYSYESCLAACLQNLTVTFCCCQLPHLRPINTMKMCRGCKLIPQTLLDNQCGCNYPCRYFDFHISWKQLAAEFDKNELIKFKIARYQQVNNLQTKLILRSSLKDEIFKPKGKTEISIQLPKLTDTRIVETKCKFVVILSQVGGILSLYIGLSLISFVEIAFDLITKRLSKTIKRGKNISKYSISVSNQILNSNLGLKLFWIVVLLAAGCATFAQTWTLMQRYNQYWLTLFNDNNNYLLCALIFNFENWFPVVNQPQEIDKVEFPSVTVCSNNILTKQRYNFSMENLMTEVQWKLYLKHSSYSIFDAIKELSYFLKENPLADRLRKGPAVQHYMPTCYFLIDNERINCSKMIESSIGAFGNCVTVNSGILHENDAIEQRIESLTMELKMTEPEFLSLVPTFGTGVIIHPKGTSPNTFKFQTTLDIPPAYRYDVAFTMMVREHEPDPYPSKCVPPTLPYYQWMNIFHSHSTPYLYTKQACEASCVFNDSKLYKCSIYLKHEYQGREDFPLTRYANYCSIPSLTRIGEREKCECRIPCREVMIETQVMKSERIISNSSKVLDFSSLSSSWLTIHPKTRQTTLIREVAAIKLWTLISEIGGTIGLYIGASLLALIELNSAFIFTLFKINY